MRTVILILTVLVLFLIGCSSGSNSPLTPQSNVPGTMGSVPIIGGSMYGDGGFQATGMLGAYEIHINPETMTAELIAKRTPAIGEDYIVSGVSFFTIAPCATCLKITAVGLDLDGNAILTFTIAHPFPEGDTLKPPSAANRLDLDVFDLAMVIAPSETTATTFSLTGTGVYTGFCVNQDGFTTELANVIGDTAALPFFLVVDDSDTGSSTFNKFAMGDDTRFDAGFDLTAGVLDFDMYLTMGYGFSARKPDRLQPKYYNPEFNRKAAWKVVVTPPQGEDPPDMSNTWNDANNTAQWPVTVEVYDWQQDATVFTGAPEEFGDADSDNVFASSEISRVSVEIPGMNSSLQSVTTPDSGTGFPPDPCKYTVPIANQNLLTEGEYIGLVKVTDERAVLTPTDGRDFLIDTKDGIELVNYEMPEYATYQTFIATVIFGNLMPIAEAVATTPTSVFEGASVTFDATASSDPDGTVDTYEWDFNENGVFDEDPEDAFTGDAWNPTHNFAYGDGFIDVQLRVTDNLGGTDELDTPITITITPSKNIVLRPGINICDLCTAENTDELYVLFEDNQVWRYSNGLTGGALHHTMSVSGTPLGRKIESTSNGDTINGYWTTTRYNSSSNHYSGSQSAIHTTGWPPYHNSYVLALYGGYTGYQADIKTVFLNTNNIWLDRYAPPNYPAYTGTFWSNANGPYHVNKYYLKGVHALRNVQRFAWIEDDPEWRLEITNYGSSGYHTAGGTQTDADGGFNAPIDITVDSNDDIFILDILSTGDRRIKKFTSAASSVGSFGDNTSMSEDPCCLDASLASGWIYVGLDDMVSVFFPSEQP